MEKLTQKRLKELLFYNHKVGRFIRKTSVGGINVGAVAGFKMKAGYRAIDVDCKRYLEHRLVWLYIEGYLPENEIDHIDRNKENNRFKNLRIVSRQCNARNSDISSLNTSGVKGVSFYKNTGMWCARIMVNYKRKSLGHYLKKDDAVKARWEAEKKYNFPNCCTSSTAYEYLKKKNLI